MFRLNIHISEKNIKDFEKFIYDNEISCKTKISNIKKPINTFVVIGETSTLNGKWILNLVVFNTSDIKYNDTFENFKEWFDKQNSAEQVIIIKNEIICQE